MGTCDVLSVDDEDDFRMALSMLLSLEGLRVSEAASGNQAVEMLLGGLQPAVVLVDFRMNGWSGPETLERMRAHGFRMPAVLLSADRQAVGSAREHGFDEGLVKPFQHDALMRVIRSLMELPPSGHGAGTSG